MAVLYVYMLTKLNIHIKGALFFLGAKTSFGIAISLYFLDVKKVFWLSSEIQFGAVTFIGFAGTFGGAFLFAFYFGYIAILIDNYRVKKFIEAVRSKNK